MPPSENTAKAEQKGHTFTQETEAMSWTCKHPRGGWYHPMNAPLICWHPSLVLLSPGRGWLQLQAVSIGQWCWSAHRLPKPLSPRRAPPGAWGLGGQVEPRPSHERKFPKILNFTFFHFLFPSRKCLPLPNLQTSPAQKHGRREVLPSSNRTSSVAELWTPVACHLEELDVHVSAVTSSRAGGQQKSQQCRRGWLGLAIGRGGHARNSQTSEIIGRVLGPFG